MSSTTGSPYHEAPRTDEGAGGVDVADPHEHHWFSTPTKEVGPRFVGGLVFAQLIFFIALLGPAVVGTSLTVQSVIPLDQQTTAVGIIGGFGALAATIGNVRFGRLSDRTTSRFGRPHSWLVGGTSAGVAALVGAVIVLPIKKVT